MERNCPPPFICPVCHEPLTLQDKSFRCEANHTFDLAREGYVNLLVGKRPKIQGDDKAMLLARRQFLQAGHYQPLMHFLGEQVMELAEGKRPFTLLDSGCGDGSYLQHLIHHFPEPTVCPIGIDIAKDAARMAAKLNKQAHIAVADIYRFVPVATNSVDLVVNVFAPRHGEEYGRILKPGGHLLIIIPQNSHLATLRRQFSLLNIEPDKETAIQTQLKGQFYLVKRQAITFPLHLDQKALAAVIAMSPSARHLTPAQMADIQKTASAETEAAFVMMVFAVK
jgi:23S rRNA (guanine745-N1)-methyltransferase